MASNCAVQSLGFGCDETATAIVVTESKLLELERALKLSAMFFLRCLFTTRIVQEKHV